MTDVFVIRNQLGHYWGKGKTWVDGSRPKQVMRTAHRDEAVNTLFELSSKDIELRGDVVAAELSERREPIIEASQIPLPMEPGAELVPDTADEDEDAANEASTEIPERGEPVA